MVTIGDKLLDLLTPKLEVSCTGPDLCWPVFYLQTIFTREKTCWFATQLIATSGKHQYRGFEVFDDDVFHEEMKCFPLTLTLTKLFSQFS